MRKCQYFAIPAAQTYQRLRRNKTSQNKTKSIKSKINLWKWPILTPTSPSSNQKWMLKQFTVSWQKIINCYFQSWNMWKGSIKQIESVNLKSEPTVPVWAIAKVMMRTRAAMSCRPSNSNTTKSTRNFHEVNLQQRTPKTTWSCRLTFGSKTKLKGPSSLRQ